MEFAVLPATLMSSVSMEVVAVEEQVRTVWIPPFYVAVPGAWIPALMNITAVGARLLVVTARNVLPALAGATAWIAHPETFVVELIV